MFKLEHHEALVLIQVIEANTFKGSDVEMLAKLLGKIRREASKTRPANPDEDVTADAGWVDGA